MTRRYLQSVLQISCPAIDLTAFTAVANAAVDVGSGQTYTALTPEFTVPGSPMNIFLAGFFLEDVAVGMYQDLIPNIVSRDLLIAATGENILTVMAWLFLGCISCVLWCVLGCFRAYLHNFVRGSVHACSEHACVYCRLRGLFWWLVQSLHSGIGTRPGHAICVACYATCTGCTTSPDTARSMLQQQSMQCNYATIMITALPLQ